jgi:hypothetical protein
MGFAMMKSMWGNEGYLNSHRYKSRRTSAAPIQPYAFMTSRILQVNSHLAMASRPDIHLYTSQTPNGIKISMTLEELGIPYKVTKIDIAMNIQKEPWFLEINPNGRIPALTDTFKDGEMIRLFESGSIQQYLIDEYDTEHKISYPKGTREYYEVNNWVCLTTNMLLIAHRELIRV